MWGLCWVLSVLYPGKIKPGASVGDSPVLCLAKIKPGASVGDLSVLFAGKIKFSNSFMDSYVLLREKSFQVLIFIVLVMKDRKDIYLPLLWCHGSIIVTSFNVMHLVVQKELLHCGQGSMSSWTMVNNEDNWLPWQLKEWFNQINNKFLKSAQSLGLIYFQVPHPQRVKECNVCSLFRLVLIEAISYITSYCVVCIISRWYTMWYIVVLTREGNYVLSSPILIKIP